MKIGLKIGPLNWQKVLAEVTPECVEVWFQLSRQKEFPAMFSALKEKSIPFGLHFWEVAKNGLEPSFTVDREGLIEESSEYLRQTIDIAQAAGAHYVNAHPGGQRRKRLDLAHSAVGILDEEPISEAEAISTLQKTVQPLDAYAREQNVLLLWETLPRNDSKDWDGDRNPENTIDMMTISPENLLKIGKTGSWLTNDFGHTLASHPDKSPFWLEEKLVEDTEKLAPYTRLLHVNTIRPPFNGTDSHNGILPEDFSQDVIPHREVLLSLLARFANRDDVWAVLEPQLERTAENYRELAVWKEHRFQP